MTDNQSWMIYGATGYTGTRIAQRALERGHSPVLAGRNSSDVTALADRLDLRRRVFPVDDAATLKSELAGVDLVLNAGGPFLHTAAPLAQACIDAGVHYLDISNELQVFLTLYATDDQARDAGVSIIPGVGFGVFATNFLASQVSALVGGAELLEVASRVFSAQPGPGAAATMQANAPYGGWIRREGQLVPQELFTGIVTIDFPDGPCEAMPVPTGDLEAGFRATRATNVVAYAVGLPSSEKATRDIMQRSFGWARATGVGGSTATALLETGDSYDFTPTASILAVEATLDGIGSGALSPAEAFGADFMSNFGDTSRTVILA
jgi:short subunit dehydrogenase-like uncharacterized protein